MSEPESVMGVGGLSIGGGTSGFKTKLVGGVAGFALAAAVAAGGSLIATSGVSMRAVTAVLVAAGGVVMGMAALRTRALLSIVATP